MINVVGLAALSVIVGVCVGILSGMLGIGGGTVLVPIFRIAYGLQALGATATSLFTIILTSLSGAVTHTRNKTCIPAVGIAAGLGGACTSPAGVMLASVSPTWCVMAAAAVVIAYSAISMFKKALAMKKPAPGSEAAAPKAPAAPAAAAEIPEGFNARTPRVLVESALIGMLAGVLSGYVGVGGGFIMVPLFLAVLGLPMKKAAGTSLIAVLILAIPGTITQFMLGNVQVTIGLAIIVGSIPGAVLGARLQKHIPERTLRFIFAGFLVVAAALLMVKEAGLLG